MPQAKKITKKSSTSKRVKPTSKSKFFGGKLSRFRVISAIAILLFAAVGTYLTFFSSAASVNFVKLGVHPQAAAQPTTIGKIIATLESWNGKLYSGFGDWGINGTGTKGPIAITSFDPVTNTFTASPEFMAGTDAIHTWRKINGNLYGPSAQSYGGDYVVGTIGSNGTPIWKNASAGGFTHVFDVVTLTGSDLWVVGQTGPNAIARRSLDGGVTWQDMRSVPSSNGSSTARFYGVGVYKGKLYLQAINNDSSESVAEPTAQVFDPATNTWSSAPRIGVFSRAEEFAGKMVFINSALPGIAARFLQNYDGTVVTTPVVMSVYGYTIDRGTNTIYVITGTGEVKKSTDLITWTNVGTVGGGSSITMHNGALYVGTSDSAIYKQDLTDSTVSPPPSPAVSDTSPPTVTISQPTNGSSIGNRVNIQANSTDNVQVTRTEVFTDGTLVKSSNTSSVKYGWRVSNSGTHTIIVKAYDAGGNMGQASATVTR